MFIYIQRAKEWGELAIELALEKLKVSAGGFVNYNNEI